jgi:putative peptide zinc metalloprotease protein
LLGRFSGTGLAEAGYLIRRPDGEFVMVSELLYGLAEELNGQRQIGELTARLNLRFNRTLVDEDIGRLLAKLAPYGVILGRDDPGRQPRPLLALTKRVSLVPATAVGRASRYLSGLFHPAAVVLVLGFAAVIHLAALRIAPPFDPAEAFREPAVLLGVVAITFMGGLFHEFGHASATAYGGGKPGSIGAGVYILWPAFFVDLTYGYAMDRRSRIRTDLGGVYFNLALTVALGGTYVATANELWLWALLAQDLTIIQQFVPFLRLDGYYLACDLAGVPDLFSLVRPALSNLRGHLGPNESAPTRRIRKFVLAWAAAAAIFLGWFVWNLALHSPGIFDLAWTVIRRTWSTGLRDLAGGAPLSGVAGIVVAGLVTVQASALALVLLSFTRLLARTLSQLAARLSSVR